MGAPTLRPPVAQAGPGRGRLIRGRSSRRRPISAMEVAEAAALADVAAAICVLSRVLPIAGAAMLVASIPFAVLGVRRRFSVCVLAGVVGWMVALLFGGYTPANMVAGAAVSGCFAGIAIRRRWSVPTIVGASIVGVGLPTALGTLAFMAVFSSYREFLFDNIRNGAAGATRLLTNAGLVQVEVVDDALTTALRHWPITVFLVGFGTAVVLTLLTAAFCWRPAASLARRLGPASVDDVHEETGRIAPVPVALRDIDVTYPGDAVPVVSGAQMDVAPGQLVAVAGHNGAGKSTLARVVAGRPPTSGTVRRAGNVGLGAPGGTAMIGQRPETGVLGLQVGDDLAWGDPTITPARTRELLERVGLGDLGVDAETARLSGGQLQRLAVAAALGREPRLLVSDETTAMIDAEGRGALMTLYRDLADAGAAVVHVTHDRTEIAVADAAVVVPGGAVEPPSTHTPSPTQSDFGVRGGRIEVRGLGFAHDSGTPWQRAVFADVDMTIAAGQTVLITGTNGAGKSTLARLLAGIDTAVDGTVSIDGQPARNDRTCALYLHQFARLSLVRSRVRDDICDAAGVDRANGRLAWSALRELGLDPVQLAEKRIDDLSVGQQRRVALAGLLASRPRVLVLDEPLAGLDEASRSAMMTALRRVRAAGVTLVIVTHDSAELTAIADRAIEVTPLPPQPAPRRSAPSRASLVGVIGRVLPNTSPAKRMWVGTKVLTVLATALMFGWSPTWISVGAGAVIAALWTAAGRIPWSALPRLPLWIPGIALIGGFFTAMGGGEPYVSVAGVRLGLDGLSTFGILISITVISLYVSLLFCWTTPMVEVPAFAQRLVGWAARVRLPVQVVAVGVTVALRLLPFMINDFRALLQTIAQRRTPGRRSFGQRVQQWGACLPIACSVAVQDAREMAMSMQNRGGIGSVARPDRRPGRLDLFVIPLVLAIAVGAVLLA